ncbi:flavin-containing monooxygenase [Nocardia takedensis]|uniref:flavin-containing monooxygenase n=1 Tax=Nocardia takedensis TaxID=259390 RepID=UPI003F76DAD1
MNDSGDSRVRLVVVGAGFGGLGMGVALKRAGVVDFVIVEEGPDVGGVWRENTYPGARCDVPSHLYSFSFAPYRSTRTRYPSQAQILAYLGEVAEREGLRAHLRFGVAITSAVFDESRGRWVLTSASGQRLDAEVVVWAVGQLHRPNVPDLAGVGEFTGAAFHSARWDHSRSVAGCDVAVVGTGSTAAQLVPELAGLARRVVVYQRSPAWVLPKPSTEFGPVHRLALGLPGMHGLYRAAIRRGADMVLGPVKHRGWSARPARWLALWHLRRRIQDRVLREKLTPEYEIGDKRVVVDSRFYPALNRPDVELVTEAIDRVTPSGLRTVDGRCRSHEVIVWATGFKATEFLGGIEVRGRGGVALDAQWSHGAEAYLGLAVPNFPSMYLLAGPNSFDSHGSNPAMKQAQIRYIMGCLALQQRLGAAALEVTDEAMRSYRRWLRHRISQTIWPDGGRSWFKTPQGRITNPWPATNRLFDRLTGQDPAHAFAAAPGSPVARTVSCSPGAVGRSA